VSVDLASERQTIEGLGGFGPARPWWEPGPWFDAAFVSTIVDDLGVSIVRTQAYWDGEPRNDDHDPDHFAMDGFDFSPTSDNGKQFPYLRELAGRGVRVVASVWTPPVWMKANPDDSLAVFCRGQCGGTLERRNVAELAEYLAAYVIALRDAAGVELYGLSIANEPLFANRFESCVYSAEGYSAALRAVGDRFERERLPTRLFGPEHMGAYEWNDSAGLFDALLDDPDTARHLDAYAVHGYLDGVAPDDGSAEGWTSMHRRAAGAGKGLWMSETSAERDRDWPVAWETALGLHRALAYGRVSAWIYWAFPELLFDDDGAPTPLYHLLKSWFRFVRPGFVEVAFHEPEQRSDAGILQRRTD
jgi:O-glycosyl hydrolase